MNKKEAWFAAEKEERAAKEAFEQARRRTAEAQRAFVAAARGPEWAEAHLGVASTFEGALVHAVLAGEETVSMFEAELGELIVRADAATALVALGRQLWKVLERSESSEGLDGVFVAPSGRVYVRPKVKE